MRVVSIPHRQIHLDFHTSPHIHDVAADFDAREFAHTLKRAHVTSVTVFAKCHHGHLYFNTRRPERHPGLKAGFDLLAAQIEALHRENIRAPIYLSVQVDEYAANTHPEWVARNPDGTPVKRGQGVFSPGWQILDLSSPYRDYVAEQLAEVLAKFKPVDGIFFDMCWDQPSVSKWAIDGMRCCGLDPESETDRARYARRVAHDYMQEFYRQVKRASPRATVYFNSRPHYNLAEERAWQTHVEIEALPTGGWGYLYFPKNVRYARNFHRPMVGMTARFHEHWGDFGGFKPFAALQYEIAQMLAHGAACSIGDQLHPRGRLNPAAYELIGQVYAHAAACEPWTTGARALTEIAVLRAPGGYFDEPGCALDGVTRMFTQLKYQFDILPHDAAFDRYRLVVIPDDLTVDETLIRRLRQFTRRGGAVLLSTDPAGFAADAGVEVQGESPYTATYLRFEPSIAMGGPPTEHVIYERGRRLRARRGATVLARIVEPYFERAWDHFCSHAQTPNRPDPSPYAAAVQHGRVITISFPVFRCYAQHGNLPYRHLVQRCVERLLPDRLIEVTGPSTLEVSVMKQRHRVVVHLLQFIAERRTPQLDIIEDIIPLQNVPLSVRLAPRPRRVYLAPSERSLDFSYEAGWVRVTVPVVAGHQMLVLER